MLRIRNRMVRHYHLHLLYYSINFTPEVIGKKVPLYIDNQSLVMAIRGGICQSSQTHQTTTTTLPDWWVFFFLVFNLLTMPVTTWQHVNDDQHHPTSPPPSPSEKGLEKTTTRRQAAGRTRWRENGYNGRQCLLGHRYFFFFSVHFLFY